MYRKDFILRMIEMMAELVAGILGLIKKRNFEKASETIENAYTDFLQQDAVFFRNIKAGQLIDKLLKEHNYTNDHLEILAELFYVEAELLFAQEKTAESKEFYEKALILCEFADKEMRTFSFERQSKISLLQSRICQLSDLKK